MGRVLALAAAALAVAAVVAGSAQAAPGLRVGVTDDAWLEFGPGTLEERVAELQEMGVQVVRVTLDWYAIEAEEGTYDWARDGQLLDALRAAGIEPVVAIWGTPSWANGGGKPNVPPKASATFASFARAAAERFPWVRRWIVWNEPNQRRWLLPPSGGVRHEAAEPRRRRDQERDPQGVDRRRRDCSPRRERRDVAGRLHARHGSRGGPS